MQNRWLNMLISSDKFSHSYYLWHIYYIIMVISSCVLHYYIVRNYNSLQFDKWEIENSENKETIKDLRTELEFVGVPILFLGWDAASCKFLHISPVFLFSFIKSSILDSGADGSLIYFLIKQCLPLCFPWGRLGLQDISTAVALISTIK